MSVGGWFDQPRMVDGLRRLGEGLRAARLRRGLTQMQLEGLSGVDQTAISRLERAKAPGLAAARFVLVVTALGRDFPFGWCPHDHECAWQDPELRDARRIPEPLYPGSPAWEAMHAAARARREVEEADVADEAFGQPNVPALERPDVRGIRLPP